MLKFVSYRSAKIIIGLRSIRTIYWSIRPTFLIDPPRRIWGAEGPGKWGGSTTEVYAVVSPHSN